MGKKRTDKVPDNKGKRSATKSDKHLVVPKSKFDELLKKAIKPKG